MRLAKQAVKQVIASSLGWRLLASRLRPPGVIVLMYHRILDGDRTLPGLSVDAFAAQMGWIRTNCDPIAIDDLTTRVGDRRQGRPAVLVTFDDGYRDYHDLAYPVLKRLGIPAVVFLATSFMDEGGMLWTDEVQWAAVTTPRDSVRLPWEDGPERPLPDRRAREALGERARAHLKKLPDAERRAAMQELVAALGTPAERPRQMLTWDEARRTMDLTTFGGHSHTHPILSRLDRSVAEREIRTCRDRIAAETGRVPVSFAYPNGRPEDYTPETQELLRGLGFTTVFSTSEGIAGSDTDWMAIKRLPGDGDVLGDFAWIATSRSSA